jgi:DNA mismatch endonuclease (patch repair protein)
MTRDRDCGHAHAPAPTHPQPTTPAVTAVMRANKKTDTLPEMRLRRELHRRGLRFRKHLQIRTTDLTVRPDLVFTRRRVAVFVDGCFWHSCPQHGTRPSANSSYWDPKLQRNRMRDARVNEALRCAGWTVLRIWEHADAESAADKIAAAIARG